MRIPRFTYILLFIFIFSALGQEVSEKEDQKMIEEILDSSSNQNPDSSKINQDTVALGSQKEHIQKAIAGEPVDKFRPNPGVSALLSSIIPGAGQFYNRKYIKSLVFLGGEATLAYYAYDNHQKAQDAYDLRNVYDSGTDEYEAARKDFENNTDSRNLKLWIITGVHLVDILDAYVDAHLAPFPDEIDAEIALIPHGDGAKVCLGFRF